MNTNDNRLKAHKLIDHIFQDLLPAHGMAQRPEQIQLSHRMLDAMQDGRIALCDAGTGIGKTYAYLAAATAASAFPTGQIARPIIISTSSIALQNAVLTEYLPLLSCVLMADGILTKPLKAVIRKGKSHYVCDERLDRRLRQVNLAKKNHKLIEINNHSFDVRKASIPNCRKIAEICKEKEVGIVVSSDAHITFDLGNYNNALGMLSEISFPEKLVINRDLKSFEAYMKEKGKELFKWHM